MLVLKVTIKVKPECLSDFMKAMALNFEGTRNEPGNIRFDVNQGLEDTTEIFLHEVFQDSQAHQVHLESPHFKTFMATVADMLQEDMNVQNFSPCFPGELV